jgi:hypothetical protein
MFKLTSPARSTWPTRLLLTAGFAACMLWLALWLFRGAVPDARHPARTLGTAASVAEPAAAAGGVIKLEGAAAREYFELEGEGRSLLKALDAERFKVESRERSPFGDGGGGYLGMSHDENLNAWFDEEGVTVRPTLPEKERGRAWRMRMRLKAYGYGAALYEAPGRAALKVKECRVEYARGGVLEWYVNRSEGIEQGFTLGARPVRGKGVKTVEPLRLVVSVSGDLRARAAEDGQSVELNRGGAGLLSYNHLIASDASGRKLDARMETNAAGDEIALIVDDAVAQYPIVVDPLTATLEKNLNAGGDAQAEARLGFAVAIDGDKAVVGAWRYDTAVPNADAGKLHVFQRNGSSWLLTAEFVGTTAGAQCGWSVAIDGSRILFGCPGMNNNAGKAFFNDISSGSPATTINPLLGSTAGDRFGESVAIGFNRIVVGSPLADSFGTDNGSTALYAIAGSTVNPLFAFGYSSGGPNIHAGTDVAILDHLIVTGSPGLGPGVATVYDDVADRYFDLLANDGVNGDSFGQSVAISNNTIVVGAPLDDNERGTDAGAAYVYVLNNSSGTWSQQQKLTAGDGHAGDFFSEHAVAVEGNTIVVGAYSNGEPLGDNSGNDDDRGAAYVYTRSGTAWTQQAKIRQSNFAGGEAGAHLGIDVDISDNTVLIGARGASAGNVLRAGAAFAYRLDCVPPRFSFAQVLDAPVLSLTACPGQNITFTSSTRNPANTPLSYQWRKDGVNIPGATSKTYDIPNVGASAAGSYDVIISNACGSEVSNSFPLSVHSFSLNLTSQNFGATGSNGSVNVNATGSFCGWTAVSNASWITITNGSSGTGNGTVGFVVAANAGTQRTGTLTIAGQTFNVTQDGAAQPANTFQFSQSGYSVSEGAGSVTVTVTRAGDTSAAATVEYATTDGSATDRGDYNTTIGRLRFAAGEGAKSFSVLVNDDAYAEGSESFNVTLGNPTGAVGLGSPSSAAVNIGDNDASTPTANPLDTTAFFVRQHYVDFLSREPDAAGLAFWTGGIDSCGSDAQCREVKRIDTSAAFFLSIEFQETGFLVHRLYRAGFDRLAHYREFIRDTQEIGRGVVVNSPGWEAQLEANKQAFISEFVARPEFSAAYGGMSNGQYVDTLNARSGNSLSQAERDTLVAGLNGGAETRATALRRVAEDADFRARETSPAFVLMQYFGYLRRNPDAPPDTNFDGYNFWLGKLNDFGGDYRRAEMVKAFLSSTEYRRRFGQ